MFVHLFFSSLVLHFIHSVSAQPGIETCNPGTFRDGLDCVKCPPGTFSTRFNRLSCEQCQPGRFRSTDGASSEAQCLFCPAGFVAPDPGSTECKNCKPGTDSLPGSQVCGACPPGTALSTGVQPCATCLRAFFSDQPTNKFCKRCPDGTFTPGGSQPFPTSGVGATKCDKCPPGTYRRNSEFDFNPVSVFLSNRCNNCQKGTFNDVAGAKSCKLCPPGTFSGVGATSCTPCRKGTANNRIFATMCKKCKAGTVTVGKGAAACKDPDRGCTFDTFADKDGECKACLPGQRIDVAKQMCIPCGENEISSGGVDTKCRKCPRNKIPFNDLAREEKAGCFCKPGLVDDAKGGCLSCPTGTFWENDFSFFLTVDGFKREEDSSRAISGVCEPCPRGTFSNKPGQTSCTKCPVNSFQNQEGSTSCKKCPRGSRTPRVPDNSEDTTRERCITDEFACAPGEVRNTAGKCSAVSCPFADTFLKGDKCIGGCPKGQLLRENGCRFCDFRATSPDGSSRKCTKCPENQEQDFRGDKCLCDNSLGLMNGKCVECPAGTELIDVSPTSGICMPCPEGTASSDQGFGICEPCRRAFFTNGTGARRCTRCPKGTITFPDLFGRFTNDCRPRDPYA